MTNRRADSRTVTYVLLLAEMCKLLYSYFCDNNNNNNNYNKNNNNNNNSNNNNNNNNDNDNNDNDNDTNNQYYPSNFTEL